MPLPRLTLAALQIKSAACASHSDGTVAQNIAMNFADALDLPRIEASAHDARQTPSSPRSEGYGAQIGVHGAGLSGGEAHRIALARAFHRAVPLILADEATAHLDRATQSAIGHAMADLARGRTLVMITHRLETVRRAGSIVVLDGGRAVEQGRHQTLIAKGELDADLWSSPREQRYEAGLAWGGRPPPPPSLQALLAVDSGIGPAVARERTRECRPYTAMGLAGAAGASMNYFTPAAIIRALAIARTGGRYAERVISHESTFRLLAGLRTWFYERIEPLAPAGLQPFRSGDLLARIRDDIDRLELFFLRLLAPAVVALIASIVTIACLAAYVPLIGLLQALLFIAAGVLLPVVVMRAGSSPSKRSSSLTMSRFDNVTLRYPGASRPALAGVYLRLSPGRCVAVVGLSGSGKSSLVNRRGA